MPYTPGLHILSEFNTPNQELLSTYHACRGFLESIIAKYELEQVGAVYHDFTNGGFTAVLCLTESHLSIHTWPEFKLATFDVFLSNYLKDNHEKVRAIYQEVLEFFEGTELQKNELIR